MKRWDLAVCERAVTVYGKTSQLIICMEEMAELTKELSKNLRGQDNLPHIAEEVADVEIMLEQVKVMFGLRETVEDYREAKLLRLSDRINRDAGNDWRTSRSRKITEETLLRCAPNELTHPE